MSLPHVRALPALRWMLLALCLAGLAGVAVPWIRAFLLEARGSLDSDILLYVPVGRSILNGFTPYIDLFESKPPGMFLLTAASLALSGNERPMVFLATLLMIAVPALCAFAGWRWSAGRRRADRVTATLAGTLFGALLSLYIEETGGMLQTEYFGAMAGTLYVLHLLRTDGAVRLKHTIVRALLILCAVALKEPFGLIIMAAVAVTLANGPRHWLRIFLLPAVIALCVWLMVLAAAGWMPAYLERYLDIMLHYRVSRDALEPWFVKPLSVSRMYGAMVTYSPHPLLGAWVMALFALFPACRSGSGHIRSAGRAVAAGLCTLCAMYFLYYVLGILGVAAFRGWAWIGSNVPGAVRILIVDGILSVPAIAIVALLLRKSPREERYGFLAVTLGLCLAALTLNVQGYNAYSYGIAAPFYAALALIALRAIARGTLHPQITAALLALTAAAGLTFAYDPGALQHLRNGRMLTEHATRTVTEPLDALLDACGFDRFYAVGGYATLAFARHSPVGPLYVHDAHPYLAENHPLYAETAANVREKADVLLVPEGADIPAFLQDAVAGWNLAPPRCADGLGMIPGFLAFFPRIP